MLIEDLLDGASTLRMKGTCCDDQHPDLLETIRIDPTSFVASLLKDRIALNSFETYPERRDHLVLLMMIDAQSGTDHVGELLRDTESAKENAESLASEILDGNLMRVELIDKMMIDLGEEVEALIQGRIARRKSEEEERKRLSADRLHRGKKASTSVHDEAERVQRRREQLFRHRQ